MNPLLVADSFLVADGTVRGLELHRRRFTSSCTAYGVEAGDFWDESVGRIPREGSWFPRFELQDGGRLELRIRPAPALADPAYECRLVARPDLRTNPRVKGPDLELLGDLKARAAAETGADEVLLVDADGTALEAAYSAILWWEGNTLCVPPSDRPVLPSVTAHLLRQLAHTHGIQVAERPRHARELAGRQIWLANALHGLRPARLLPHPAAPTAPAPAAPASAAPHPAVPTPAALSPTSSGPSGPDIISWQRALQALAVPL